MNFIEFVIGDTRQVHCINMDKIIAIVPNEEVEAKDIDGTIRYQGVVKLYFGNDTYINIDSTGSDEETAKEAVRMVYDKIKMAVQKNITRITL